VHPTGGSLRVFKQFTWLEIGSGKVALSRLAHQRVTHTVGLLSIRRDTMTVDHVEELIDPENALRIYDKIFTARTGHGIFFTSRIKKRAIVHPPPPLAFNDQWNQIYRKGFQGVVNATGEDAFYFSRTTRFLAKYKPKPGFENEFGKVASVSTTFTPSSMPPYAEEVTPLINDWIYPLNIDWNVNAGELTGCDYAVYSLNGTWGLWFSADGFMIIGGPEEFVDTFFQMIGSTIEEMVVRSFAGVRNREIWWGYLSQLFGEEQVLVYKSMYGSQGE
jgi:hypothetical protein